jgi:hypothetical protein
LTCDRIILDARDIGDAEPQLATGGGRKHMNVHVVSAPDATAAAGGYAQAIEVVDAKRLLFISGQTPETADCKIPESFEDQARLVWANLEAQLWTARTPLRAYSINSVTAKKAEDGSVAVQFGGCDGKVPNCLPIMEDWNYIVRLYRPRPEVLDGNWKFPEAQSVN